MTRSFAAAPTTPTRWARCDVDGDGLDEIFANWQKLTMGLRGDGAVLWEDRTQEHHSDFVDYGDVDGDGKIEVVYDHAGCDAAEGPIYVVEPLTGKIKAKIDYRQQGVRHAQNIALGNFDKTDKGLEIAFCEKGSNIYLFDATGKLVWKRPVPASLLSKGDWDGDGDEEILRLRPGRQRRRDVQRLGRRRDAALRHQLPALPVQQVAGRRNLQSVRMKCWLV